MNQRRSTRAVPPQPKRAQFIAGGVLTDFTGTQAAGVPSPTNVSTAEVKKLNQLFNTLRHFVQRKTPPNPIPIAPIRMPVTFPLPIDIEKNSVCF